MHTAESDMKLHLGIGKYNYPNNDRMVICLHWLQCGHLYSINTVLHPGFHLIETEPQEVQHDRDQEKKGV